MRQVGELTLSPRSLKLKLQSLVEMLVTLGFLTDVLSSALLAPFASLSNPLGSVKALAALTLLSSLLMTLLITTLLNLRGESLRTLCLGARAPLGRDARLGLLLVPGVFLTSFLIKSMVHHLCPAIYSGERNVLEDLMRTPADLFLFLAVALFAGGFREELQRAFIIRRFEAGWGPAWLGAVLFSVFFGLSHLVQGKDEAIIAGVLGLLWGGVYVVRRNIAASSISHGLYDALELVRYYLWGPLGYF